MKIIDKYEDNGERIYTVELEDDVLVDVKCIDNMCYVMQCEDGYEVFNRDGNTFDYHFNEDEVVNFVREEVK
jgi:hypothetical protein